MTETLTASIDIGWSLGKGCWSVVNGPPKDAGFGGHPSRYGWVAQANAIDEVKTRDLAPDSCLVEIKDKAWTVGESARYITHSTNARAAKSRQAAVRVLGMLGKILEVSGITEGNLDLRVLLPTSESKYFSKLENTITKALYEVRLNGHKPGLRINSVRVYPEGAGVARKVSDPRALILMWGHKDVSILPVQRNIIQAEACHTLAGMGMISLINEFPCEITDELLLAELLHLEAVGKGGLKQLVGEDELKQAQCDFQGAKQKVWNRIYNQLQSEPKIATSPKIYVTGGSMRVWQNELRDVFGKRLVFFRDSLKDVLSRYPDLKKPENKEIAPRLTDSFLLCEGGRNG